MYNWYIVLFSSLRKLLEFYSILWKRGSARLAQKQESLLRGRLEIKMKNFLAFRAFFVLVCIVDACIGDENRHDIYSETNNATVVATGSALLDTLGAADVEKIMLSGKC
jgi:hypothetical protein